MLQGSRQHMDFLICLVEGLDNRQSTGAAVKNKSGFCLRHLIVHENLY